MKRKCQKNSFIEWTVYFSITVNLFQICLCTVLNALCITKSDVVFSEVPNQGHNVKNSANCVATKENHSIEAINITLSYMFALFKSIIWKGIHSYSPKINIYTELNYSWFCWSLVNTHNFVQMILLDKLVFQLMILLDKLVFQYRWFFWLNAKIGYSLKFVPMLHVYPVQNFNILHG